MNEFITIARRKLNKLIKKYFFYLQLFIHILYFIDWDYKNCGCVNAIVVFTFYYTVQKRYNQARIIFMNEKYTLCISALH